MDTLRKEEHKKYLIRQQYLEERVPTLQLQGLTKGLMCTLTICLTE